MKPPLRVEIVQLADPKIFSQSVEPLRFGVYVFPGGHYGVYPYEVSEPTKADFYEVWGVSGLIEFLRKLYDWDACFPTHQEAIE